MNKFLSAITPGKKGAPSSSNDTDASVDDSIKISRSDGLKNDLNKAAINGMIHSTRSGSIKSHNAHQKEEHDHGNICISRSDGHTHDIIKVFKGTSDSGNDNTLRIASRNPSVARIDLSGINLSSSANLPLPIPPNIDTPYYLKTVRIVHISDTLNFLQVNVKNTFLPDGHILVHSGNFSQHGAEEEFAQFNSWLGSLTERYHYRIVCLGSRDVKNFGNDWSSMMKLLTNATHVLCHNEATILGIRFYAAPWHWGHKKNYSIRVGAPATITTRFDDIPLMGIHVLITHGPAYDRLDMTRAADGTTDHWGSSELLEAIKRCKPGVHLHGHVKDSRGVLPAFGNFPLTVNSSMCDRDETVLYAAPHVIRADQLIIDAIRNIVTWNFSLDTLGG